MPRKIPVAVRNQIRKRADFLCEYCHTDERWQLVPFTIDHIVPISAGGTDDPENLALACFHYNRRKSNKQFVEQTAVFNPRKMLWNDHFIWSSDKLRIVAKTQIGKATIELLDLNRPRILLLRQADIEINRHSPSKDAVQN